MGDAAPDKREERKILKNIILIGVVFLLDYTGVQGLGRLQSTLHSEHGIGVITFGVLYLTVIVSGLVLPTVVIKAIGAKWSIALAAVGHAIWMTANGYAVWATMLPASILSGLAEGLIWSAQGSYFTLLAPQYARLTSNSVDAIITRFFGILFGIFQASGITCAILTSLVLGASTANNTTKPDDSMLSMCGANSCPYSNSSNPNLEKPPPPLVWTLVGINAGLSMVGVMIIVFFVDNLPRELRQTEPINCKTTTSLLLSTAKLAKRKEALLLLPITMYTGMEVAFFQAEFSQAYIACSIGIPMVGYVALPFGIMTTLISYISARAAKYTGQIPLFLSAMALDLCIQFTLMFWMPKPDEAWVLYLLSTMWGYTDGIWHTHLLSTYGMIFPNDTESAFSWRVIGFSLGSFAAYSYSYFLCTSTKLIILTSLLVTGILGYLAVVIPRRRSIASYETDIKMDKLGNNEGDIYKLSYTGNESYGHHNNSFKLQNG